MANKKCKKVTCGIQSGTTNVLYFTWVWNGYIPSTHKDWSKNKPLKTLNTRFSIQRVMVCGFGEKMARQLQIMFVILHIQFPLMQRKYDSGLNRSRIHTRITM